MILTVLEHEFRRHQKLADNAMTTLNDEQFFQSPRGCVNSIAVIVKHLAGNLTSRWTGFFSTDGEKPSRNRDQEFLIVADDTRLSLMQSWEQGWSVLYETLASLNANELDATVSIRGEPHTVLQALVRGLTHAAYHTGQITYLARMLNPDSPWLTIPPGQSDQAKAGYLSK